jgi:6-pyruvoyltetrahydropterin/6-carboxytetrahydropterin synthase
MISISKRYTFEASHHLPLHDGKCKRKHGHSYKVDVVFSGQTIQETGPETGMLMDFSKADEIVAPIIEALDHTNLNKNKMLLLKHPTAENIATKLFSIFTERNGLGSIALRSVRVWETEKCWAEVSR